MTSSSASAPEPSAADALPAAESGSKTALWSPAARFALLNTGLLLYGLGLSAMIRAGVGLAPWDAFHVGIAKSLPGATIGMVSIGVGLVLQVIAAVFLRMPIGVGSVFNIVLIGVYIDRFLAVLPAPVSGLMAWAMFLTGTLLVGLATGMYIASHFGAGPRDSLVLGLARRTGWPVKYLRSGIELAVLFIGFLLGAKIGWGTLAFALIIGPAMSVSLGLFGLRR